MTGINAIFARDREWGIGIGNQLPWPRSDVDMKWFRDNTLNGIVVMGRRTWESIGSTPLPRRTNIVVTTSDLMSGDGAKPDGTWSGSMVDCFSYLRRTYPGRKIWVIGGGDLYRQTIPLCDHVYMTEFAGEWECDAFVDKSLMAGFAKAATLPSDGCEFSIWSKIQ